MFENELEINVAEELPEIPPEYQDAFRQAIARELADMEQDRTDTDILAYLRQRRDDFKRGGFIRPDGRPGMVTLNPETMYEQALPQLAQSSLSETDAPVDRRRLLLKVGVLAGVVLLFLFFVFRGRAQREAAQAEAAVVTPTATAGAIAAEPTAPLPEITGVDDSLQTIGSLGGALTIGRPSALTLSYRRTEETIALAIDPSKPTPKGEMRYNETTMLSDNPVAVWIFGTVLNYAIGIPDSMVRNLTPGDRLTLRTDTGAALRFVVIESGQQAHFDVGGLLSQDRLGVTLFALPAAAANDVSYAFAAYDVSSEADAAQTAHEIGEDLSLAGGGVVQISAVQVAHTAVGMLEIAVSGSVADVAAGRTLMLSLTARGEQTTAVPLTPAADGSWQARFTLPDRVMGRPLFAELRTLPDGEIRVVQLPPPLAAADLVQTQQVAAWWDAARAEVTLTISIHNPEAGPVLLPAAFIQLIPEGGDADEPTGQVTPRLPLLLTSGDTVRFTMTVLPPVASMRLQVGADLWQITGVPAMGSSE